MRLRLNLELLFVAVTIFGQCWQSAGVSTTCFYTKDLKIDADVYVDVGLKSFNVTLKGEFVVCLHCKPFDAVDLLTTGAK